MPPQSRRRPPARWPMFALLGILLAVVVIGIVRRDDGDETADPDEPPATTTTTSVPTSEVPGDPDLPDEQVAAYRILYRVEGFGSAGSIVDTEERWVRRPFDSRVETRAGEVPGMPGRPTFSQVAVFGVLESAGSDQGGVGVLTVGPNAAPGEARLVDLSTMEENGLAEFRHEGREIAGRDCQVWRLGGPIDVGRTDAPTETDHADVCVDEAGLVLQETWVVDGTTLRRRTAQEVDLSPDLDDDRFEIGGEPTAPRDGGGGFGQVTDESRAPGVTSWELPDPPDGFEHEGRYAFSPPNVEDDTSPVPLPRVGVILDVYLDGPDLLVVENGGVSSGDQAFGTAQGSISVDLGDLGEGELLVGLWENAVRIDLGEGRFVRVRGTLTVDDLLAVARALEPVDGTGAEVVPIVPPEPEPDVPLIMDITRCTTVDGELVCETIEADPVEHEHDDGETHSHGAGGEPHRHE